MSIKTSNKGNEGMRPCEISRVKDKPGARQRQRLCGHWRNMKNTEDPCHWFQVVIALSYIWYGSDTYLYILS